MVAGTSGCMAPEGTHVALDREVRVAAGTERAAYPVPLSPCVEELP